MDEFLRIFVKIGRAKFFFTFVFFLWLVMKMGVQNYLNK